MPAIAGGKRAKPYAKPAPDHLLASPPIPMLAPQTADSGVLKRPICGRVTVYEPRKTTVYRQKYRHKTVAVVGFSETMVDTLFAKNRITSMTYSHPETC
jgi:hypothetical protein